MRASFTTAARLVSGSLALWTSALSPDERATLRAIAASLAANPEAARELETWLVLGHAAIHAWAAAERDVADLKDLLEFEDGLLGRGSR